MPIKSYMPPVPQPLGPGDPDPKSIARGTGRLPVPPLGPGDDDPASPVKFVVEPDNAASVEGANESGARAADSATEG